MHMQNYLNASIPPLIRIQCHRTLCTSSSPSSLLSHVKSVVQETMSGEEAICVYVRQVAFVF